MGSVRAMTIRHDGGLIYAHIGSMTSGGSRLERARTLVEQRSASVGPLARVGLRSLVLVTVSMLAILVGLPAAIVAAGT